MLRAKLHLHHPERRAYARSPGKAAARSQAEQGRAEHHALTAASAYCAQESTPNPPELDSACVVVEVPRRSDHTEEPGTSLLYRCFMAGAGRSGHICPQPWHRRPCSTTLERVPSTAHGALCTAYHPDPTKTPLTNSLAGKCVSEQEKEAHTPSALAQAPQAHEHHQPSLHTKLPLTNTSTDKQCTEVSRKSYSS